MKQEEITALSTQEIVDKIKEETASLAKMKINHAVSPVENPMKIRFIRKDIAMLNAELQKRQPAAKNSLPKKTRRVRKELKAKQALKK